MIPEVFIFYDSASSLGNIWDWFVEGLRTGRTRRLSKRQVSKEAAFLKGTSNYLGDPYQGEGHNISQLQYCRKANPWTSVTGNAFSVYGGKKPYPLSLHINASQGFKNKLQFHAVQHLLLCHFGIKYFSVTTPKLHIDFIA